MQARRGQEAVSRGCGSGQSARAAIAKRGLALRGRLLGPAGDDRARHCATPTYSQSSDPGPSVSRAPLRRICIASIRLHTRTSDSTQKSVQFAVPTIRGSWGTHVARLSHRVRSSTCPQAYPPDGCHHCARGRVLAALAGNEGEEAAGAVHHELRVDGHHGKRAPCSGRIPSYGAHSAS